MTPETKIPDILVTASVPEEAAEIKAQLAGVGKYRIGGRPVFDGRIGETFIRLLVTGPGMVNTVQSLTAAIEASAPGVILMTGCAGGFARAGMCIGDIGVADEENDAHLGIEPEKQGMPPLPLPFDLEVIDGKAVGGCIPLDATLSGDATAIVKDGFRGKPLKVVCGPFVTVSTVTATDRSADGHYDRFQACMESMEGIAGAHVAVHYGIPFLQIRCASNLVGKRNRDEWDLSLACRRSGEAAAMWIKAQKNKQWKENE